MTWAVINEKTRLPICEYDSVIDYAETARATIPNEPQEGGFFYSYDKTHAPKEISVNISFSGDFEQQQKALNDIEALRVGLTLCTLVTPVGSTSNMALVGYSVVRGATAGANSMTVALEFQEVVSSSISSRGETWTPKNPTSANVEEGGSVRVSKLSEISGIGA